MPKKQPDIITRYGIQFSADFPVTEMDAIADFDLVLGFSTAPMPLYPVEVELMSGNDLSIPIEWNGHDCCEDDGTIFLELQSLLLDGHPVSDNARRVYRSSHKQGIMARTRYS